MKLISLKEWRHARQYIITRLLDCFIREQIGAFAQPMMVSNTNTLTIELNNKIYCFAVSTAQFLQHYKVKHYTWTHEGDRTTKSNIIGLMRALYAQYSMTDHYDLNLAISEYKIAVLQHAQILKKAAKSQPYFENTLAYYDHLASFMDHPLYPTARAKLGFSIEDLIKYAPEYAQVFELRWLAIEKSKVQLTTEASSFWPTAATFGLSLQRDEPHQFIPVHPFAYDFVQNILSQHNISYIKIETSYLKVRATLSVRTVALVDWPHIHIKLPLNIRTLSTKNIRLIKPSTINDGAVVQSLLNDIVMQDPTLNDYLQLCDESFGGCVANLREVAFIVRTYPNTLSDGRYLFIPVASLNAKKGAQSVIEQLCHDYYAGNLLCFLKQYFALQLHVHLKLAFKYGIALEANQQNSIIVIDKVTAKMQLLLKDNDAPRIHKNRLLNTFANAQSHLQRIQDVRILHDDESATLNMFNTIIWQLNIACIIEPLIQKNLLKRLDIYRVLQESLDQAMSDLGLAHTVQNSIRETLIESQFISIKHLYTAGTFLPKHLSAQGDINKFYGDRAPNFMSVLLAKPKTVCDRS